MNIKAAIGTAVVLVVLVGGGLLAAGAFQGRVRAQVLSQSEALLKGGKADLAMQHLERFLARNPDDVGVLDRYTRLLSEAVLERNQFGRIDGAIQSNDRLLRLDPEGTVAEDPQQNRRWLAELYILKTDQAMQAYGGMDLDLADQTAALQSRYGAARAVAEELIERGADDAEAHRLKARAIEGVAGENQPRMLQDEAVPAYERALTLDPADGEAAERLALIYRDRLNQPDAAGRVLEGLVRNAPDDPKAQLIVYRHYAKVDGEKADRALDRAAELAPDDPAVLLTGAEDALGRGDLARAAALLDRLPEAAAGLPRIGLMRATIDLRAGRVSRAIDGLRGVLHDVSGADRDVVWMLCNTLIETGNLAAAEPLLNRYRDLAGPGAAPSYHLLRGIYYQRAGRPDSALVELADAEQGMGKSSKEMRAQLLLTRARCKLTLQDRFGAVEDLRAAVGLDPASAPARLALAEQLAGEGIDRAMAELREGIAAAPDSLELRAALLQYLLVQQADPKNRRRSWAAFDAALAEARAVEAIGDAPALLNLEIRRQLIDGRTDDALTRLAQAVERDPKATALWAAWIDTLGQAGRRQEALAVLERASAPEAAGDNAAFRVARAQLLSQLGRGREAIEVLAEGANTLPIDQRGAVLQALGRMQAARGQFTEARASYEAWKTLQPGSAAPPLALLELAIDTGDRKAAEQALDALRGGPDAKPDADHGLPYRLGKAEYLLRVPGSDRSERARRARVQEALKEIGPLFEDEAPTVNLPAARLLRGFAYRELGLLEKDSDRAKDLFREARADLKHAWEQGEAKAGPAMIDLMAQLGEFAEIDALPRLGAGGLDVTIDRLAAEACLRHNSADKAAEYVERATAAAPDTPEFAAWRLGMLDRLGRGEQVEQALLARARSGGDAASWVALIRYQAARGGKAAAEASIAEMKQAVQVDPPELLEAQMLQAIGDQAGADLAFEAALAKKPDDPEVLLAAARSDLASGRAQRALERVEAALAKAPDSRPASRFRALLMAELSTDAASWDAAWRAIGDEPSPDDPEAPQDRLARALILARHPDASRREEAVGRLEAIVGDQPSGDLLAAAARETLAKLLLQQGRADRAVEVASVTALAGANPAAVALYVQALIAAEQVDEAARQLDRLRNLAPDSPAVTELDLLLVEARAEAGSRAEELERAYREAVEAEGAGPKAADTAAATFRRLVQLGDPATEVAARVGDDLADRFPPLGWLPSQWHASRDEYPKALDLAEKAIASDDPTTAFQAARAVLTVVERSKADPSYMDRAGALIERAAAAGNLPAARAVLAMFRHFQGRSDPARFEDEIRIYRELLESDPTNVIYLNNLAWALSETGGQPDEALSLIDQAIRSLGARQPELLDTRGVVLDRLGRHDEAVAAITEVIQAQPNRAVYHFHLARAQQAAGQADAARSSIARALELGLTPTELEPSERAELEELQAL